MSFKQGAQGWVQFSGKQARHFFRADSLKSVCGGALRTGNKVATDGSHGDVRNCPECRMRRERLVNMGEIK